MCGSEFSVGEKANIVQGADALSKVQSRFIGLTVVVVRGLGLSVDFLSPTYNKNVYLVDVPNLGIIEILPINLVPLPKEQLGSWEDCVFNPNKNASVLEK